MHRHVEQIQVVGDLSLIGKQSFDCGLALRSTSKAVKGRLKFTRQPLEMWVSEVVALVQTQRPQLHFGAILTNRDVSKEPPIANLNRANMLRVSRDKSGPRQQR